MQSFINGGLSITLGMIKRVAFGMLWVGVISLNIALYGAYEIALENLVIATEL